MLVVAGPGRGECSECRGISRSFFRGLYENLRLDVSQGWAVKSRGQEPNPSTGLTTAGMMTVRYCVKRSEMNLKTQILYEEEEEQLLIRRKRISPVVPERAKGKDIRQREPAAMRLRYLSLRYESTSTIDPVQDKFDTSPASLYHPSYSPYGHLPICPVAQLLSWLQCRTSAVSGAWWFGRKVVKRSGLGVKGMAWYLIGGREALQWRYHQKVMLSCNAFLCAYPTLPYPTFSFLFLSI